MCIYLFLILFVSIACVQNVYKDLIVFEINKSEKLGNTG